MRALVHAFADSVGLRNDIYSYAKEIELEEEVNNGVLVFRRFLDCDLQHLDVRRQPLVRAHRPLRRAQASDAIGTAGRGRRADRSRHLRGADCVAARALGRSLRNWARRSSC
jgi:hypothetical protein